MPNQSILIISSCRVDVLARLTWDTSFHSFTSPSATIFTIGYIERFSGIEEQPLHECLSHKDTTDREWIPRQRIKCIKDGRTKNIVWDRQGRIDRIFGSGVGARRVRGKNKELERG